MTKMLLPARLISIRQHDGTRRRHTHMCTRTHIVQHYKTCQGDPLAPAVLADLAEVHPLLCVLDGGACASRGGGVLGGGGGR